MSGSGFPRHMSRRAVSVIHSDISRARVFLAERTESSAVSATGENWRPLFP
jgi:hypothetical protein